jgi:N6-adenosine-specific RNA methylase IME4
MARALRIKVGNKCAGVLSDRLNVLHKLERLEAKITGAACLDPAPGTQPESVIEAPRGKHSEKPDIFYEIIEKMFPTLSKANCERKRRPGWKSWGGWLAHHGRADR